MPKYVPNSWKTPGISFQNFAGHPVQLNRFSKFNGDKFKDTRFVECLPVKDHILTVPLKLDDVSFSK